MKSFPRYLITSITTLAMAAPLFLAGCGARVSTGYRYYDPGYRDYHSWDNNEGTFYSRWESDNHRDHRDFRKRSSIEQKEYWEWRHNHR